MEGGVRVVRVPVLFRVSKGVIMPTFGLWATRLVMEHDIVCLHLPQFDAAGVAARGRLFGKPTTLTYHCDLKLPPGLFNRVVNQVVHVMNRLAGGLADRVVAYTEDFARHSPYLQVFSDKIEVVPPPVELPEIGEGAIAAFRKMHNLDQGGPVIGMAARLAAEKGIEVLLHALPRVLEAYPRARVLFAGQYRDVMGEEAYARRLAPLFRQYEDRWTFLGVLRPVQMAAFYPNLDVIVVPSLNSTESFGLVQAEAMLCGTPSIASDLPGVRQPVEQTGMGEVVPIGDSEALAEAIIRVVSIPQDYARPREEIEKRWSTERTAEDYEALFERLLKEDS
jgi:glycosyltransferase involved in cell wall biosynthesis